MNTKTLQDKKTKVYEDFFQQHEIVFSCPFVTNWSGDILGNYAGVSIRQKLPLRMYIGISLGSKNLELGNITYYDISIGGFSTKTMQSYGGYFGDIFNEIKITFGSYHAKINVLSECAQSLGLGFTSIFSMLLMVSLLYATKQFNRDELYECKKANINDSLQDKNGIVRSIFKKAMLLDIKALDKCGYTSKICSFFDGAYPIIGFREDNGYGYTDTKYSMNFYGFRINDLWPEIGVRSYYTPYDFSILYTGKPFIIESISQSHLGKLQFNKAKDEIYDKFEPICGHLSPVYKPKFFKQLLEPTIDVISSVYGKMVGSISIEILFMFKEILGKHFSEAGIHNFLYALNKFKLANNLTRNNSEEFMKFINHLESFLDIGNANVGIFPNDTTISGGCLSIVAPIETVRKRVQEFVDNYDSKNTDNNVSLVYANRLDDSEIEGIKIEQDLSMNISSLFSTKINLKIINWDGSIHLSSHQAAIENTNNDIIVDLTKNKIFIHGKVCNSNELHSQSITCEILYYLIQNNTNIVPSKGLNQSSYTKNKSDMVAKVVNPFIKLIQKKFDKSITIDCNGHTANFDMEFDLKDIKIGILKEI